MEILLVAIVALVALAIVGAVVQKRRRAGGVIAGRGRRKDSR